MALEDDVCAQHVVEVGFLWVLRDQATRDAAYDLRRLAELDERVEANLDALRLADARGWEHALSAVADGEAGEVFAAATLAVERADFDGIARILDAIGGNPALQRGFVSGLGWAPLEIVRQILPALLDVTSPPELQWMGISAAAIHREPLGESLTFAASSEDVRVRTRAFVAAGQLGRIDLLVALTGELQSSDPDLRFAAARAGAMFKNPAAIDALGAFARGEGTRAEIAADTVARALDPLDALRFVQALARTNPRTALAAAVALGEPSLAPWLLECVALEEFARPAAWALTTMMGIDLIDARARGGAPKRRPGPTDAPEDEDVAMDPDESLDWPDAARLKQAWERHQVHFPRGRRFLLGRELSGDQLSIALREAVQPIRRGAALEIALRNPGRPLFPTSAPAFRQRVP